MDKYLLLILILLLIGCGSNDVAITQTGNPPKVSLGVSIYNDTTTTSRIIRESNDSHDTISSINITSAIMIIEEFQLLGANDTIRFDDDEPYILDLALDSSTIILDTVEAEDGQMFDSAMLYITDLTEDLNSDLFDSLVELQDLSMMIKGFVNGDSSKVFEFPIYESIDLGVPLSKQFIVGRVGEHRMVLVLDVKKWFIDENKEILNPFFPEDRDDIEESIFQSIYSEEEEFEDEELEEEEHEEEL